MEYVEVRDMLLRHWKYTGGPNEAQSVEIYHDCETVFRRSSRCDPCYDWPFGCPGVDLSAGSSDASEVGAPGGQ